MPTTVTTTVRKVTHITAIVSDVDRALDFYTGVLGMEKRDDQEFEMGDMTMRWLTVGCPGQDLNIVISTPVPTPGSKTDPASWIGNGAITMLEVADCRATVEALRKKGVTIQAEAEDLPWGVSAIIRDPDGNPYNLIEPRATQ